MKLKKKREELFDAIDRYVKDKAHLLEHYAVIAIKNIQDKDSVKTAQNEIMKDEIRKEMRDRFINLVWAHFPSNADDIELP